MTRIGEVEHMVGGYTVGGHTVRRSTFGVADRPAAVTPPTAKPKPRRRAPKAQAQPSKPAWYINPGPPQVRLSEKPSKQRVALSGPARDVIVEELVRFSALADESGIECGGLLLGGTPRSFDPTISISDALPSSSDAEHRREAMSLGIVDAAAVAARRLGAEFTDDTMTEIGCWHSHPGGRLVPSKLDLEAGASVLRYLQQRDSRLYVPCYLMLIVSESALGQWSAPQLAAWIVRGEGEYCYVCERAEIR